MCDLSLLISYSALLANTISLKQLNPLQRIIETDVQPVSLYFMLHIFETIILDVFLSIMYYIYASVMVEMAIRFNI